MARFLTDPLQGKTREWPHDGQSSDISEYFYYDVGGRGARILLHPFFFNLELSLTRKETQEINSKRSAHILSKVHLGSFTRERKSKKGTAEGNFCTFQTDGESVQNRQKTVRVWGFGCGEGKFQFSSVAQSCPSHCDPMDRSTPGLPVHHQLPEFTQTHVPGVSDAKFNKVYPLEISQHPPRPKPPRLVIRRGAICS